MANKNNKSKLQSKRPPRTKPKGPSFFKVISEYGYPDVKLKDENGHPLDAPAIGSLGLLAAGVDGLYAWRKAWVANESSLSWIWDEEKEKRNMELIKDENKKKAKAEEEEKEKFDKRLKQILKEEEEERKSNK